VARAKRKASPTRNQRGEALTEGDRQALTLAIETARKHSPADQQQIDGKLESEPWFTVAVFAAHGCQETALNLAPWQCWPPCAVEVDDDDDAPGLEHRGIRKSAVLLRRMLALGVSRWHPDPLAAIEATEAERMLRMSRKEEEGTNAVDAGQDMDTLT
jgi:hypothetical protein